MIALRRDFLVQDHGLVSPDKMDGICSGCSYEGNQGPRVNPSCPWGPPVAEPTLRFALFPAEGVCLALDSMTFYVASRHRTWIVLAPQSPWAASLCFLSTAFSYTSHSCVTFSPLPGILPLLVLLFLTNNRDKTNRAPEEFMAIFPSSKWK